MRFASKNGEKLFRLQKHVCAQIQLVCYGYGKQQQVDTVLEALLGKDDGADEIGWSTDEKQELQASIGNLVDEPPCFKSYDVVRVVPRQKPSIIGLVCDASFWNGFVLCMVL